ncbi:MAG: nuclear transport factor 2 family protein [Gemmatimonadaceae bacterium]
MTRLVHDADARDWPAVRARFADTVDVDYTSLAGGEPARMPADQLVAAWRALLPGFHATQHLLGPVIVELDGDHATARAHTYGPRT